VNDAPRTYFVTRHAGARDWAARRGHQNAILLEHLDAPELDGLRPGDQVLGTLPVHLAADVCARGARYFHLSVDIPHEARGRNLTADEMERFGARLEEFVIRRVRSSAKG
jgi:CRISPR-associated protein Csx16